MKEEQIYQEYQDWIDHMDYEYLSEIGIVNDMTEEMMALRLTEEGTYAYGDSLKQDILVRKLFSTMSARDFIDFGFIHDEDLYEKYLTIAL